jgi:subtilisin family serine protease
VIAGIDWVTSNHQAGVPAVANMSLGGGYSQALNAAVRSAVADGITFAVAAGNSGDDACGASPAAEPSAITVGATESNDAMAYYSNWGSCVDVFAPGSAIVSASNTSTTGSRSLSGTSMAAPHVAGAAALLLSGSTGATPATVAAAIREGATTNVISGIGSQSPNLLLDINSGIVPAVPAPGNPSTPGTPSTPTPNPRGDGDSRTPTPGNPSTPPVRSSPGGIHSRDILATPRLRSVVRTPRGLTIRMTMSKGATGYQVFANGRIIGRMAHTNGTIRASVRRGAKIQVRAITPISTSALSNAVRS